MKQRLICYHAAPFREKDVMTPSSYEIVFTQPIPMLTDMAEWRVLLEKEGAALEAFLHTTISGGVYDVLLRKMLERRAILLAPNLNLTEPHDGA